MSVRDSSSDSLFDRLGRFEQDHPTRDAIVGTDFSLSYAQLARLVRAQAKRLADAGISGDSVVGIKCADDTRHLLLCLATIYLGATSCTIPSRATGTAQNAIMRRCGATTLVGEELSIDPRSQAVDDEHDTAPEPAPWARLLFSTSGTTGEPKLVVHRDSDLVAQAHRHIDSTAERFVCLASMEHNFVKRHRLYCVAAGATNVFIDADHRSLVARCRALDVNVLHVSAFQAQDLLAIPDIGQLSGIRLKLGGSHVPLALRRELRDKITANLQAGYGTTETGAIGFTDPDDAQAGESVGRPLPGLEVRAMAADGTPLENGAQGELAIRGDGMFRGYLGNPELTAARLKDGWFHTGDIGYLDAQRRIHLCGRADDMFLFNSMNIYPQEIESQICQHPDVVDAAVLPRPSPVHGNIPVALVVVADGAEPDLPGLRRFVRERLGVRSPRQYTVVDEIPRNATGKIARRDAVNLSASIEQIRGVLAGALRECDLEYLKPALLSAFEKGEKDIDIEAIELDSLGRMALLLALETEFEIVITPQEFGDFRSLGDLVARAVAPPAQPQGGTADESPPAAPVAAGVDAAEPPQVVRFFRRILRCCATVAELGQAITTMESRLTPLQLDCLRQWQRNDHLVTPDTGEKFRSTVADWIDLRERMLLRGSGKPNPEPFELRRIRPAVSHVVGPGSPADKTLLVCFATRGNRQLSIANTALMQFTDAARYDLLIVSEPLNAGYRLGVPSLGHDLTEVVRWIGRQDLVRAYRGIRTLGCSAGGYAALVAGYLLQAEVAVCVGGRFDASPRYAWRNIDKLFTIWGAARRGDCRRVILSYATDDARDRKFARIVSAITGASRVAVEFTDAKIGHGILTQLFRRGELAPYLQRTVFAEPDDKLIVDHRSAAKLSFPIAQPRPNA